MKKITVVVKAVLIIEAKENVKVSDIITEMDYNFTAQTNDAKIIDTELDDYDIIDSN